MLNKEAETYVVVITCIPSGNGYYKVELGDAGGEIYELMVHEEIILDDHLIVGRELDRATFHKLQNSMAYQKAYSYAIGILARRMYTEKEIRRKLIQRDVSANVIQDVISKLVERNLLNDVEYARVYIENQLEMGKKSKKRIISDLYTKGIATPIIDKLEDLFDKESEREIMIKEIEKAHRRYSSQRMDDFKKRSKIIQSLGRKGFDYDEVQRQYVFFIEDLAVEET